jgi:uncharacterized protein YdcH (DUF465 family)
MEKKDATLIEQLARENEEFRKLLEQHHNLEENLAEYEGKPYLTAAQAMEKTRLKKLKLAGKDRMEAILKQYRSGT